jgi:hypothetical protein
MYQMCVNICAIYMCQIYVPKDEYMCVVPKDEYTCFVPKDKYMCE